MFIVDGIKYIIQNIYSCGYKIISLKLTTTHICFLKALTVYDCQNSHIKYPHISKNEK